MDPVEERDIERLLVMLKDDRVKTAVKAVVGELSFTLDYSSLAINNDFRELIMAILEEKKEISNGQK